MHTIVATGIATGRRTKN